MNCKEEGACGEEESLPDEGMSYSKMKGAFYQALSSPPRHSGLSVAHSHSPSLHTHTEEEAKRQCKHFGSINTTNKREYEEIEKMSNRPEYNKAFEEVLQQFYQMVDEESAEKIKEVVYKFTIDVGIVFLGSLNFVKRKHRGWTAIHIAASHANVKAVQFLFAEGGDIEALTPEGETALHIAAKHGAAEVVSFLLECNVFLRDRQNYQGVTALMKAVFNTQHAFKGNYRRCVHLLLGAGCNPNISSSAKVTALHVAVDKGDLQLVTKLLKSGANVNAICDKNTSPLLRALVTKYVNKDIVTELLQVGADTSFKLNERSLLHIAVSRCDDRVIKTFLENGADPNCLDGECKSPLWVAVKDNNVAVVPILVAGGGDINFVRPPQLLSLLSQAVINNSLGMVKLLLALGATPNTETIMWSTPLHYAVDEQNINIIKELLRANCPLNTVSNAKYALRPMTPVQLAMELGNVEIICFLIKVGCKVQWSWFNKERISFALASKPEAVQQIVDILCYIPSLLHLTRLSIREHMKDPFKEALEQLTKGGVIPQKIADYLSLADILD